MKIKLDYWDLPDGLDRVHVSSRKVVAANKMRRTSNAKTTEQ
jgi:hypothetical protein